MRLMMASEAVLPAQELRSMVHDLIIALVFLAIIIAPAIVTIPGRDEKDSL
jgi:hypothetical protein